MSGGARPPAAPEDDGPRRRSGLAARIDRPTLLTVALTLALATAGVLLALRAPAVPLLAGAPTGTALTVALIGFGVACFVAELGLAHVEIRRQAYSFSLSHIPLLLGLLYLPPEQLLVIRVLSTAAAFVVQRAPTVKVGFNIAAYTFDTALLVVLADAIVGTGAVLDLRTALLAYLCLVTVETVMSFMVMLAITINQVRLSGSEVAEILVPAVAFVSISATISFIAAMLISAGALGAFLLGIFALVTALVYRGYLVLRRRHSSLVLVQEFIEQSESAGSVEDVAERLLTHVRTLVRAARVELTLREGDPSTATRISVDEAHRVSIDTGEEVALDWPSLHARQGGEAVLLDERGGTAGQRRWLQARGVGDALVVPLSHSQTEGVLVALDRLGDATTFTRDDLALLQALAGHLAVAVHSRRLMQQLRYEATHDALTGLPNRMLLGERLSETLACDQGAAVVLLDLNRFKEVNDALGHHVGDQLLQVVARRLRESVRPDATVARLGGDEFAVLLPSAADADVQSDALAVAHRVERALRTPVDLAGVSMSTDASLGVAVAAPGESHTDLLRHADTAMYAGKTAGAGVMVYTPALDRGRAERLALLADLHVALEEGGLHLRYQPKLDLSRGAVTSVEALVRWAHPALGPLTPDTFIPLAESTGLIDQLTKVVLSQALRQCRSWQDEGYDLAVAVNLSARNINDTSLPEHVAGAIVEAGVPARKLILEITESSVMGDPERTVPVLQRLADIGVTLSLDDFGTGHSSLSYLQRLPVRELKIDRSFVHGLSLPREAQASAILVRSIVGLGRSLDLRIVAEGVENAETLDQLRDYGCDVIQGYYVGRPLPAEDVDAAGPFRVLLADGPV